MAKYKYSIDVRTNLDQSSVDKMYKQLEQKFKQDFQLDVDLSDQKITRSLNVLRDSANQIKEIFGSIQVGWDTFDFKFDSKKSLKNFSATSKGEISHALSLVAGQFTEELTQIESETHRTIQKGTQQYANLLGATKNAMAQIYNRFGEEIARTISQDIPIPFEELISSAGEAVKSVRELNQEVKEAHYEDDYQEVSRDIERVSLSANEAAERLKELNKAHSSLKGLFTRGQGTVERLKLTGDIDAKEIEDLELRLHSIGERLKYISRNKEDFERSGHKGAALVTDDHIKRAKQEHADLISELNALQGKYGEVVSAARRGQKAFDEFLGGFKQAASAASTGIEQLADVNKKSADKIIDDNKRVADSYGEIDKATMFKHLEFLNAIAERRKGELGADIGRVSGLSFDDELVSAKITYYTDKSKQAIVETYRLKEAVDEASVSLDGMGDSAKETSGEFAYVSTGFSDNVKKYQDEINRIKNTQINLEKQQSKELQGLTTKILSLETSALGKGSPQTLWSEKATENYTKASEAIGKFKDDVIALKGEIGTISKEDFNKKFIEINDAFIKSQNEIKNWQLENRTGTDLKAQDVEASVERYKSRVDALIADVKNAGLYIGDLEKQLSSLHSTIHATDESRIVDAGAFTTFQDEYKKAQAEYQKIKRMYSADLLSEAETEISKLNEVYKGSGTELSNRLNQLQSDLKKALDISEIEKQHEEWIKLRDEIKQVNAEVQSFSDGQKNFDKLYSDLRQSLIESGKYSVEKQKAIPGSVTHEYYDSLLHDEVKNRERIIQLIKEQSEKQADLIPSTERQASLQAQITKNEVDRSKITETAERQMATAEANKAVQDRVENQKALNKLYNDSISSLRKIGEYQTKMAKTDKKSGRYEEFKTLLKSEGTHYKEIREQIEEQVKIQEDSISKDERHNAVLAQILKNRESIRAATDRYNKEIEASYQKVVGQFNYDSQMYEVERRSRASPELKESYKTSINSVKELIDRVGKLDKTSKEYHSTLIQIVDAHKQMKILEGQMKSIHSALNFSTQETKNYRDAVKMAEDYYNKFKDGFKHDVAFDNRFKDFLNDISNEKYIGNVKEMRNEFAGLREEARGIGAESMTLFQGFKDLFDKHFGTAIIMGAIQLIRVSLRGLYQNVVNIDTAMTELKKVSEGSLKSFDNYLKGVGESAIKLGTTITSLINATAGFARLGMNLQDSDKLGQLATLLYEVGDMQDIASATSTIVSTMAAFEIKVDGVMDIVDKINNVSNNFSIEAEGLANALTRSASALSLAGSDLNTAMALITAANVVVQDPETVGTALKVLSLRIRGTRTELEDMGESLDGMASTTSFLRDRIKALSGVDIMINEGTFKDIYQILKEISEVYDTMGDTEKAATLELLAGKTRANTVASILQNFHIAEKTLATSLDAVGSATRENEKRMDSISGKQAILKAQFEEFSITILNSDLVKGTFDISKGFLGFLTEIAKGLEKARPLFGDLTFALAGIGGILAFRNTGIITSQQDTLKDALRAFDEQKRIYKQEFKGSPLGGIRATGMSFRDLFLGSNSKKLSDVERIRKELSADEKIFEDLRNKTIELDDAIGKLSATGKNYAEEIRDGKKYIREYKEERESEIKAVESSTLAYKANAFALSLFRAALNMVIIAAISWAIHGLVTLFTNLANASQVTAEKITELNDQIEETTEQSKDLQEELSGVKSRLLELSGIEELTLAEQDELSLLEKTNEELTYQIALLREKSDLLEQNRQKEIDEFSSLYGRETDTWWKKFGFGRGDRYTEKGKISSFRNYLEEITMALSVASFNPYNIIFTRLLGDREYMSGAEYVDSTVEKLLKDSAEVAKARSTDIYKKWAEAIGPLTDVEMAEVDAIKDQVDKFNEFKEQNHQSLIDIVEQLQSAGMYTEASKILYALGTPESRAQLFNVEWFKVADDVKVQLVDLASQGKLTNESFQEIAGKETTDSLVELAGSIEQVVIEVNHLAKSGALVEDAFTLGKAVSSLSELASKTSLLSTAFSEMADSGGLSAGTIESIIALGDEYSDMLYVENEQVKLNTEAYEELTRRKTEGLIASLRIQQSQLEHGSMEYSYVQKAIDVYGVYLDNLKAATKGIDAEKKSIKELIDELKALADITTKISEKQALSTLEMLDMIEQYPDLITSIQKTAEGYLFEADSIEKVIKARTKDLNLMAQSERMKKATSLIGTTPFSEKTAENFYNKVMSGEVTDASLYTTAHGYIDGLSEYIEVLLKEKNFGQITSDIIAEGFLSGATGTSGDVWKDAFTASLNALQYQRDKDVISEREYLEQLRDLNESYFANREKYLDEWRQYDVEYYNGMKSIREQDINDYITYSEELYAIHQNEMQLINDLQWAFDNWVDLSDEQSKSIAKKIKDSQNRVAEKNIKDLNFQIEMLQEGIISYTQLIEKYQQIDLELRQEMIRLEGLGYGDNSTEIQNTQKQIIENQKKINDLVATYIDNLQREITLIERLEKINIEIGIDVIPTGKPNEQIISYYEDIMDLAQKRLNELYSQGYDNNSSEVRKYQDLYYNAYEGIISAHKSAFDAMQKREEEFNQDRIQLLEEQINSLNSIIEQTVRLIKHENEQVIKNLNAQKDSYQKIIDKRKELLKSHREEERYSDNVTKKQKEIDVKQKRLNALMLNDSRQAVAERMTLEEELADLRKGLEDYQADYALDKQVEALDNEYKAYAEQLDGQISLIQDYLTQEGRLREDALNRLKQSGTLLYQQLIDYNKVYGSGVETDITNAWGHAQSALLEYGNVQGGVLNTLNTMNHELETFKNTLNSLKDVSFNMADTGYNLPNLSSHMSSGTENGIINAMKENSRKWLVVDSNAERNVLHQNNKNLAEKYSEITGNRLMYNDSEGLWYLNGAAIYDLNDLAKLKKYHSGGVVGGFKALNRNEEVAKLLVGETVLTPNMLDTFTKVTLPNLLSVKPIGREVAVENMVKVEFGDVTQDVMPEVRRLIDGIPNKVASAFEGVMSGRGVKLNAIKRGI